MKAEIHVDLRMPFLHDGITAMNSIKPKGEKIGYKSFGVTV